MNQKNQNVVIIGAGFGGLSLAALLAQSGYQVNVIEKNESYGGRASVWKKDGFTFDMGPSWFLMPDIFEDFFKKFDKKISDLLDLRRLDPSYRIYFGKDDIKDISANLELNRGLFNSLEDQGSEKLEKYQDES